MLEVKIGYYKYFCRAKDLALKVDRDFRPMATQVQFLLLLHENSL